MLSDAEVICAFMEPRPDAPPNQHGANELWWRWGWRSVGPSLPQQQPPHEYCWLPRRITLDAIHEVEERLTDRQWTTYQNRLEIDGPAEWQRQKRWVHVSAEHKIRSLAAVLRGLTVTERAASAEGNSSPENGVVQGEEKR